MKKIFIFVMILFVCLLTGCDTKITQELLDEAIDKQIKRSYYMESKFGVDLDYALLPYKLIMEEDSDYNVFTDQGKNDNSIKIEWEILSENIEFETLTSKQIKEKGFDCRELLSNLVYSKLSYYNDKDEVLAVKIDYFKNMPTAKLKGKFSCQEFTVEKEYEIINLIDAGEKFMQNHSFYGSDDFYSKNKSGSASALGLSTSWKYKCIIDYKRNEMIYNYEGKNSYCYIRYDMVDGKLYYGYNSSTEDYISIHDGSFKVAGYEYNKYLDAVNKIIEMIKLSDEYLILTGNNEMLSPFYETGNYPIAENIVQQY